MPPKHNVITKDSNNSIQLDFAKCIGCNSCVRACEAQGVNVYTANEQKFWPPTIKGGKLEFSGCIGCGQCVIACPVSAIVTKDEVSRVKEVLASKKKTMIALIAPSTRVAIGEAFGMQPGEIAESQLIGSLKQLGFDKVYDVNFGADETTLVDTNELLHALGKHPIFTSCCPGWINMAEMEYPELLPMISTAKSCVAMVGSLSRKDFPDSFIVDVMPCTAKKDEHLRPILQGEIDCCITVVEMQHLIKESGIDFKAQKGEFDAPYSKCSGGAHIFGKSAGVGENVLRQLSFLWKATYEIVDSKVIFEQAQFNCKVTQLLVKYSNGKDIIAAIACGGSALHFVASGIRDKSLHADLVEMMACPLGCQNGGGMPRTRKAADRANGLVLLDNQCEIKAAGENAELWSNCKSEECIEHQFCTSFAPQIKKSQ